MDNQTPLPPSEPNKLQQALQDYEHMENERNHLNRQLDECTELNARLVGENEALKDRMTEQTAFYTKQIEALTFHNLRLGALSKGLVTRLKVVRECIEVAELEAHMESVKPAAHASTVEQVEKPPADALVLSPKIIYATTGLKDDDPIPLDDMELLDGLALHDPERRPAENRLPLNSYP
jgi:hypothetical protein